MMLVLVLELGIATVLLFCRVRVSSTLPGSIPPRFADRMSWITHGSPTRTTIPTVVDSGIAKTFLVRMSGGIVEGCHVEWRREGVIAEIRVVADSGKEWAARTEVDFEETLLEIYGILESEGLLLACNRFRKNVVVTSMSRQFSDGLSCYEVRYGRGVSAKFLVQTLDAVDPHLAVPLSVNRRFLQRWIWSGIVLAPVVFVRSWFEGRR